MNGPGIRAGIELNDTNIVDLAPTILFLMGIDIPEDMDGVVVRGALDESLQRRPVTQTGSTKPFRRDPSSPLYTEEELKIIHDRLKGLGYIE
jgi:arylsulfatase A-like enzyme